MQKARRGLLIEVFLANKKQSSLDCVCNRQEIFDFYYKRKKKAEDALTISGETEA